MSSSSSEINLGIIPARGGSKGIKKKNIRLFCGAPLINYSIDSARNSNLDCFLVSTDSDEIAEIARLAGAPPPFMRPEELARDDTNIIPVLQHCVLQYEAETNTRISNVFLLQPTSPWRTVDHINDAIDLMKNNDIDSVCSVVDAAGIHPLKMKKIHDGLLTDFVETGLENPSRQSLPQVFNVNGCVYAVRREILIKQGSLKGARQKALIMGAETAISIDTDLDFRICEFLFQNAKVT